MNIFANVPASQHLNLHNNFGDAVIYKVTPKFCFVFCQYLLFGICMHAFPSYFKKSSTKNVYNFTCKCSSSDSSSSLKIFVSFYMVSPICLSSLILQKFIPLCKRTRFVDIQFHLQILTKLVLNFCFLLLHPHIYIYHKQNVVVYICL